MTDKELDGIQHSCMWVECFGKKYYNKWIVVKDGKLIKAVDKLDGFGIIERGSLIVKIPDKDVKF